MFTAQAVLKTHTHGRLLSRKHFTAATQQGLAASAEAWAQQTLNDLGYRSLPYAEGYWRRDGTQKQYDWGDIVLTLDLTEGR